MNSIFTGEENTALLASRTEATVFMMGRLFVGIEIDGEPSHGDLSK